MWKFESTVRRKGLLDDYRRLASFDWCKLRIILEGEEIVKFKEKCWSKMESDSLFSRGYENQSFDEHRKLSALRAKKFKTWNLAPSEEVIENPAKLKALFEVMVSYDSSFSAKYLLSYSFVQSTLRGLGTDKHMELCNELQNPECQLIGSFSLTEISHGTNAKAMRTTATFDLDTQHFILNTPDFEAAKCWIGNLGKTATHTILFAQLILPSGENCGLHAFVVPVRDPKTLISYPGVKIGDLGPKVGLNGMDNGFIVFTNYPVSKDNLLNKNGDVTADGKYITSIKDPNKRYGSSLGTLSAGRVAILTICYIYLAKALTISIRYSAVRKQFGPPNSEELPVIEYPLQQWRLFRYLAGLYALKIFCRNLDDFFVNAFMKSSMGNPKLLQDSRSEIHALSCATKPVAGWLAQDGIQESREACGGHGYLKCAGIGDLRNDNDANLTYEGDNNVLLQQTSQWLLSLWARKDDPTVWDTPLRTVSFLKNLKPNVGTITKFNSINDLLLAYEWLIQYLLDKTAKLHNDLKRRNLSDFDARNNSQIYAGRDLSIVYAEYNVLRVSWEFILNVKEAENEKNVLENLIFLYGAFSLERHLSLLYEGGLLKGHLPADSLKTNIINGCKNLKKEAISLVDVIAPPDFCINSPLGSSDGQVYSRLESALTQRDGTFVRPLWWKELVHKL